MGLFKEMTLNIKNCMDGWIAMDSNAIPEKYAYPEHPNARQGCARCVLSSTLLKAISSNALVEILSPSKGSVSNDTLVEKSTNRISKQFSIASDKRPSNFMQVSSRSLWISAVKSSYSQMENGPYQTPVRIGTP